MNLALTNLKEKYEFNQISIIGLIGTKGYNNPVFFCKFGLDSKFTESIVVLTIIG